MTNLKTQLGLLVLVPLAPALHYLAGTSAPWVFLTGAVAIGVLADWISRATEQLASRVGPAIGGLVNVSFGSMAEFILALFVLASNQPDVVRAQITGSILGTSLLGLGLAAVIGGIGREAQRFDRARAGLLSSMLILVVIALLLPAIFDATQRAGPGAHQLELPTNNSASAFRSCCSDCMGRTLSTRWRPAATSSRPTSLAVGRRLAALGLGHGAGDGDGPISLRPNWCPMRWRSPRAPWDCHRSS